MCLIKSCKGQLRRLVENIINTVDILTTILYRNQFFFFLLPTVYGHIACFSSQKPVHNFKCENNIYVWVGLQIGIKKKPIEHNNNLLHNQNTEKSK